MTLLKAKQDRLLRLQQQNEQALQEVNEEMQRANEHSGNNQFFAASSSKSSRKKEAAPPVEDFRDENQQMDGANHFYAFNQSMAPCHDAAHQRTLSPNVIQNLDEVDESDAMAESMPFEPSSPIASRDFGLSAGVGQFSD